MPISQYLLELRRKIGHDRVLMPGVTAVVLDAQARVLLHRSADDGRWYTPGGALDPGEEPADAVVREVYEETGVQVVPERLVGVYVDPLARYANGDEVLYVSTAFACRPIGGEPRVNDEESTAVRYFAPRQLPEMLPTHRLRIEHALQGSGRAWFRWNGNWREGAPL